MIATLSSLVSLPSMYWVLLTPYDVSPLRLLLPKALPSAGVTLPHRYYDPSDFLQSVQVSSLLHLSNLYCPPCQSLQDLPRLPIDFNSMPCSKTPGMLDTPSHGVMSSVVFWWTHFIDHPTTVFRGSITSTFRLTAYYLPIYA